MLLDCVDLFDARALADRLEEHFVAIGGRALEQFEQFVLGLVDRGGLSSSRERQAFSNACLKVGAIDIASPTDFIWLVSPSSEPGNFSKAKRGHLTTT